ncbi:unnamed protein product, partial [Strongylus vulgaris]
LTTTIAPLLDRIFSNTSLGHRLLERLTLVNLRHTLYLITPYETSVQTLEEVPNYNVEVSAWWMTFVVLEFFILKISGHHDRFALNDSITSICAGMLSQCFKFGGRTVAIFLYVFIWNNFRLIELPWESPWTWLLCLVFQDLMYYLGHRAVHEAGFFWGLHTIHHSSEYYNFSTALRQAAIQDAGLAIYDVLQAFCIPPPIFLVHRYFSEILQFVMHTSVSTAFCIPPPIFLVHRYFSEILQFVMHTSLIDDLGPLGIIFNTPSHHRVHHGRNPYCIDKNYGGVFILWDKMFGTFAAERKDDPPVYGLVHNENTFNQIYLQAHVLWDMIYFKGQMKDEKGQPLFPGIVNKIKAALYPPGWFPGVPVRPFFHWLSLVDTAYGVPEVYYIDFTLKIAFFLITMQTFSAFFDKKWYAPSLEISRCVGVVVFLSLKLTDKIGVGPHRLFMIGVFVCSALLWIGCCIKEVSWLSMQKKRIDFIKAD